jgi:hypothetical protein
MRGEVCTVIAHWQHGPSAKVALGHSNLVFLAGLAEISESINNGEAE